MSKNNKELKSILFELSTPEERAKLASDGINNLLDRFNGLYTFFQKALQSRDEEYSSALELLITETDKQVKGYLNTIQKDTDLRLKKATSLISQMESLTSKSDDYLNDQIEQAKCELKDFKEKVSETYSFYRDEMESLFVESRKSIEGVDVKTERLLKEIESVRRDFVDRVSDIASRGGGSMPFQVSSNGTVATKRYADINFVNGTGMTITVANNNTTKATDITFASSGSGGGSTLETPSGVVDGNNATFTPTSKPKLVVTEQGPTVEGVGYIFSGGSIIMNIAPSQFILDFY